jgi:hypothetical protein
MDIIGARAMSHVVRNRQVQLLVSSREFRGEGSGDTGVFPTSSLGFPRPIIIPLFLTQLPCPTVARVLKLRLSVGPYDVTFQKTVACSYFTFLCFFSFPQISYIAVSHRVFRAQADWSFLRKPLATCREKCCRAAGTASTRCSQLSLIIKQVQ